MHCYIRSRSTAQIGQVSTGAHESLTFQSQRWCLCLMQRISSPNDLGPCPWEHLRESSPRIRNCSRKEQAIRLNTDRFSRCVHRRTQSKTTDSPDAQARCQAESGGPDSRGLYRGRNVQCDRLIDHSVDPEFYIRSEFTKLRNSDFRVLSATLATPDREGFERRNCRPFEEDRVGRRVDVASASKTQRLQLWKSFQCDQSTIPLRRQIGNVVLNNDLAQLGDFTKAHKLFIRQWSIANDRLQLWQSLQEFRPFERELIPANPNLQLLPLLPNGLICQKGPKGHEDDFCLIAGHFLSPVH